MGVSFFTKRRTAIGGLGLYAPSRPLLMSSPALRVCELLPPPPIDDWMQLRRNRGTGGRPRAESREPRPVTGQRARTSDKSMPGVLRPDLTLEPRR